jgi:Transglycosylase SLT domain
MPALGQIGDWQSFAVISGQDCPSATRRWRTLNDGRIEIEGLGAPKRAWPKRVDGYNGLIAAMADKYAVPAIWIATIMALESGGRSDVCYRPGGNGTPCSTKDGAGLMALLESTATSLAGRAVSLQELMDDPVLSVDLGTQLLVRYAGDYGDDIVKIGVAYNAGGVYCRPGPSGHTVQEPKEPCPPTPWGVLMGCIRTATPINDLCAPSTVTEGRFACPNNYPQLVVELHNAAVLDGWTTEGLSAPLDLPPVPGTVPPEPEPLPWEEPPRPALASALPFGLGAAAGYYAYRYLKEQRIFR